MVRVYFTLDGETVDATEGQFENDVKAELESEISNGNTAARLLLETDCSEDFYSTYEQLAEDLRA